jgi:hypothetical protein
MPSELRYWTVLDPSHRVVVEADDFLLHHRLGRDGAESTSQSYAASPALFFAWAVSIRKPWRETAPYLGRFVYWLQHYRPDQIAAASECDDGGGTKLLPARGCGGSAGAAGAGSVYDS